jgi:hypothetical protein
MGFLDKHASFQWDYPLTYGETKKLVSSMFEGKVDKGKAPYVNHLFEVAKRCEEFGSDDVCIVALLHDSLEDIEDLSVADLLEMFSQKIVNSVLILTKKKGVPYSEYIDEVIKDPIAMRVKVKDLEHNLEVHRLSFLDNRDIERIKKYHITHKLLTTKLLNL